jgi:hypothetical protein
MLQLMLQRGTLAADRRLLAGKSEVAQYGAALLAQMCRVTHFPVHSSPRGPEVAVVLFSADEKSYRQEASTMALIYIGNLDTRSTEASLRSAFEPYGKVEKVEIISNFAFVEMANEDDATTAISGLDSTTAWFLRPWKSTAKVVKIDQGEEMPFPGRAA